MTYNDEEFYDEIRAVKIRYSKALDAGDSKRRGLEDSYTAITDSVSDVPWLLEVIDELQAEIDNLTGYQE